MSFVSVFVIIAAILYAILKPKNGPERTSGPTEPAQSLPPRRKGWMESLEDMMNEGRWDPYSGRETLPQSQTQRTQGHSMVSAQRETFVERKRNAQEKEQKQKRNHAPKSAVKGGFDSCQEAVSMTLDPNPFPVMYKKAPDGKMLRMEPTSIVQGFIWSQVLGDPKCKCPPSVYRRGGVP